MKTYRIVGKTNPWIAQRDIHFKGKTKVVLHSGLTLKEASKMILDFFNEDYHTYYPNWGLVCARKNTSAFGKGEDKGYEYDLRTYYIEPELTDEQECVIAEYASNACDSSRVAEVFAVTEKKVKDAIDYCDFLREVDKLVESKKDNGYEFDRLMGELANRILF